MASISKPVVVPVVRAATEVTAAKAETAVREEAAMTASGAATEAMEALVR
jgi:hypothetical protein